MQVIAECKRHGPCRHEYLDVLVCTKCDSENRSVTLEEEIQAWQSGAHWGIHQKEITRGPGPHVYEEIWEEGNRIGREARRLIDERRRGRKR